MPIDYRFNDGIFTLEGEDKFIGKLPEELVSTAKEKFNLEESPYLYVSKVKKNITICHIDLKKVKPLKKKPLKCTTVRLESDE